MKKGTAIFLAFVLVLLSLPTLSYAERGQGGQHIIYVNDYGADPLGERDSTEALIQALDQAKMLEGDGEVVVRFKPGRYRLTKEKAQEREVHTSNTDSSDFPVKKIGFLIENHQGLTIDGQGAKLLIEGDMMAVGIFHSTNIRFSHLSWDYQVPSCSEMTVFGYNQLEKYVDYFIPEYMPYEIQGNSVIWKSEKDSQGNYYWKESNDHRNYGISVKYPSQMMGRSWYSSMGPFKHVRSIQKLDNGLLRV